MALFVIRCNMLRSDPPTYYRVDILGGPLMPCCGNVESPPRTQYGVYVIVPRGTRAEIDMTIINMNNCDRGSLPAGRTRLARAFEGRGRVTIRMASYRWHFLYKTCFCSFNVGLFYKIIGLSYALGAIELSYQV